MSRRTGKAPIDPEEQQRLRDEQQRLLDEAEARRIEERRLQIEQEPNPPEVLQYARPPVVSPLQAPPWTPFGFDGNPEVTQDEVWRDLNVDISYEEMQQILNEDRERAERERAEREEGDIPVPEIMIKMQRGRKSSSTGQLVDVRGN